MPSKPTPEAETPKAAPSKPIKASMTRKQMRETSGFETESYAYDFRSRNNLKPKGPAC